MADVSSGELRRNTAAILRHVERVERVRVILGGPPVARLVPIDRPRTLPWPDFVRDMQQSDAELSRDLAELAPDTTDDLDSHQR